MSELDKAKELARVGIDALEHMKLMAVNISRSNTGLYHRMLSHCNANIMALKRDSGIDIDEENARVQAAEERVQAEAAKADEPQDTTDTEGTDTTNDAGSNVVGGGDSPPVSDDASTNKAPDKPLSIMEKLAAAKAN